LKVKNIYQVQQLSSTEYDETMIVFSELERIVEKMAVVSFKAFCLERPDSVRVATA
jgi:hypothetical protein